MTLKDNIDYLLSIGFSKVEISRKLNCSKSVVTYHLNSKTKLNTRSRTKKDRINNPIRYKIYTFIYTQSKTKKLISTNFKKSLTGRIKDFQRRVGCYLMSKAKFTFNMTDFLTKFSDNKKCYLSGRPIDFSDPSSFSLDHIIPASKGGDNSLDNCALINPSINKVKSDLTVEELLNTCKEILEYNGYLVTKV